MLQRMRRGHVLPFALASLVTVGGISTSSVYAYPARHRVEAKDLIPAPETAVDRAKRAAARRAVDHYVKDGMAIGVGSGSTIVYAIQRLAERFHGPEKDLHDIVCIPTSFQSRQLLSEAGLPLGDLTSYPELDVAIDGADEVDRALNCIKGGGACQTQEKMVAAAARTFVVVADHRKQSECLGREWRKGVPLEVIPEGYRPVLLALEAMGAKPVLRMATAKAGPVVTDNGNFVIDADFGDIEDVVSLNARLSVVPGVVETGLFPSMATHAYFGQADGSVQEWRVQRKTQREDKNRR